MMNEKQLEVWSIREANEKSGKSYWKHAGRAFVNQDGSINILLDVLPIEGKLQIRKRREEEADEQNRGFKAPMKENGKQGLPFQSKQK